MILGSRRRREGRIHRRPADGAELSAELQVRLNQVILQQYLKMSLRECDRFRMSTDVIAMAASGREHLSYYIPERR